MTLAMPIPPTSSATAPSPRNRVVVEPAMANRAASASDGRLTDTSSGSRGLVGAGQHTGHAGGPVGLGPHVDAARVAVEAEVPGGDGHPDQRGVVQLGRQFERLQDADDGVPPLAQVHLGAPVRLAMPRNFAAEYPRTVVG